MVSCGANATSVLQSRSGVKGNQHCSQTARFGWRARQCVPQARLSEGPICYNTDLTSPREETVVRIYGWMGDKDL
jgi:hypothetical protein